MFRFLKSGNGAETSIFDKLSESMNLQKLKNRSAAVFTVL